MTWFVTVNTDRGTVDLCEADVEGAIALPENVVYADAFMASHSLVDGAWQRKPVVVEEPTPEEIAAADAACLAAEAEASEAREMEIVRLSGPDQLLRAMGKITIAELTARVAVIRARVEAG